MKTFNKIAILFVLHILAVSAFPQQTERDKGIELYKRGDSIIEATRILESVSKQKATKDDGEVWNYLGLLYAKQNRPKEARKALERAVKLLPQDSSVHSNLGYVYLTAHKTDLAKAETEKAFQLNPKNFTAYLIHGSANLIEGKFDTAVSDADQAIKISPDSASAYFLKSDGLFNHFGKIWQAEGKTITYLDLLMQSKRNLEVCLTKCSQNDLHTVQEKLEVLSVLLDYFNKPINNENPATATPPEPGRTPINITSKPRANYTDSARQSNVQGTITLAVIFGADAQIKYVFVLKGLGKGLDEEAVNAAKGIIFQPETKDGKPITVVKQIQYSFTIY